MLGRIQARRGAQTRTRLHAGHWPGVSMFVHKPRRRRVARPMSRSAVGRHGRIADDRGVRGSPRECGLWCTRPGATLHRALIQRHRPPKPQTIRMRGAPRRDMRPRDPPKRDTGAKGKAKGKACDKIHLSTRRARTCRADRANNRAAPHCVEQIRHTPCPSYRWMWAGR